MTDPRPHPVYGAISGPVVIIGFGSIGRGTLPLIERHFDFDRSGLVVVDPDPAKRDMVEASGYRFVNEAITADNFRALLTPLLSAGAGQGFCVNLSVDTSSRDIMVLCREIGALYIDTVTEPWPGFYFDEKAHSSRRTNYALRETVRVEKHAHPGGTTAVSCCGANPGMVSWLVKQALVAVAEACGLAFAEPDPDDRQGWARLMRDAGVKGIHIAERDTQGVLAPKPRDVFLNTWSVEGFISEGLQPAELGWGTHERWMPPNAHGFAEGPQCAIYLDQPGAATRVHSWCPTPGPQYGLLVTHNEAVSISDYFTLREGSEVSYRPTCHYAYHPCNNAVLSLFEMFGNGGNPQPDLRVMEEDEIVSGRDELGVLLYGHDKNAYWYGSQLSIAETRALAPFQNATGLQVTSAVLAGMVWALENPEAGIVEADEMDFRRCLEVQRPYLGPVNGYFTDWTPLTNRLALFPEDVDRDDPWQFRNVLVR